MVNSATRIKESRNSGLLKCQNNNQINLNENEMKNVRLQLHHTCLIVVCLLFIVVLLSKMIWDTDDIFNLEQYEVILRKRI